IRRLSQQSESLEEFKGVAEKTYGLFLFAQDDSAQANPLFWNNQKVLPRKDDFPYAEGVYFENLLSGHYLVQKSTVRVNNGSDPLVAYVLIPVLQKYYLQTDYLPMQFMHDKGAIKQISITYDSTDFPIRALDGRPLFYIKRIAYSNLPEKHIVTVLLRLTALILLLVYLQLVAETINKKYGSLKATGFLAFILIATWGLLHRWPEALSFRQFSLFEPIIYASSPLNRSLGDLLLNAIIICWIILFAWFSTGPEKKLPPFMQRKGAIGVGIACIFVLIFSTFQLANLVNELVTQKIPFNVTNFFELDIYTVFGFLVLALLTLSYYYFSQLLFWVIKAAFPNLLHLYFAVTVVGLAFLTLRSGDSLVLFHLPVLLWLVVYTLLLGNENFIINSFKITIAGILFWIFVFSASLALLVLKGNREKEFVTRKNIAEKYDRLTDPKAESILSIASTDLDSLFLRNNFSRFYLPAQNHKIRDSIADNAFFGNPYNIQIYVYDRFGNPVNNLEGRSFAELNTLVNMQTKQMVLRDLWYIETSYDKYAYILKRSIADSTGALGTFFILATPKQYQNSDAPYPEFFRRINRNDPESSPYYSYAVYRDTVLRNHSSKYAFPVTITRDQIPADRTAEREHTDESGTYDELWYKATNKIIVVAKKKDSLIESITLFSYLFCAFLLLVGLLRLATFFIKMIRHWRLMEAFSKVTIRTQLHGTIIFISVLSFLIIGFATISFFINRYNRNNADRLSRTAAVTVSEMQKRVDDEQLLNGRMAFSDSSSAVALQKLVQEIAEVHGVDANVYDLQGNLMVSSSREVYTKGILSNKMHPLAYYRLKNLREVQNVQQENMSSFKYLSIYTAIRNKEGRVYAYLNIPYFSSQLDLKQEISNFFVTIINLNAFIFLLAGVIALFITNKITRSFLVIGNKMKEITLGKAAEEIVWNRNDEIGELVAQYNRMVNQLEQSAEALAKSEREGAWREMARQVAHEIKNPLTPMKLSIQYLQKAIQHNQPNIQELTTNVANTLIEQIDHLSKIAADFSQFANIGNKKLEVVDLHTIIASLVDLYSSNPKVHLRWNPHEEGLFMRTDKTHMNRLFTNLLSNAVDACIEKSECRIVINEERKVGEVLISVTDNGGGISEEMQSKIFTPNFTTKTSGTGLGLAMCKSIVEQAEGHIWFETAEGKGTTFFIRLPLVS
ncbi:MAG TPA: HAMP domain-containing sensor histidine kinase, partial [Flavisolibacter sp.]|nr:HAMP domain-containing sensor histidine kinase [Flavisolibacter sp.]